MSDTPILRALSAAVGVTETAPDGELLRRFAEAEDRTAFELVVRRHAELVWGVCRGALPRDSHAAEDAFQATFLILARKAMTVQDVSAAGWLFRVARNVAVRARGRAARRDMRPLPDSLATAGESAEEERARNEVVPVVAEEVDRLTASLRDPVVLCFFEGHTQAEAAERLGWPIGTVASRLARAKDLLRDRLTRRGVVLPAGGLAAVLAATQTATAAPAALVRAAVAITAGPAINIPPAVHSLTEGVLSAMRFAKLKALVAALVVSIGVTAAFAAIPQKASADRAATAPSGLTAGEVGGFARAVDDKDDKIAKELERRELQQLQGKWRMVKQDVGGQEIPAEVIAGMRITIEKDTMTVEGKVPRQMKLNLAPGKSPKELDWTVIDGSDKGEMRQCIYKVDGDKLAICITEPGGDGKGRPKEFKAGKGLALIDLEKVKDEKDELAALAGEWKAVKGSNSGKDIPDVELSNGMWVIKDAELTIVAEGDADEKASIKLDPTAVPPTIDIVLTKGPAEDVGAKMVGVYFRQGDKLFIAFRDPTIKNPERPTELKPGENVAYIVFERVPKK